MKADNSDLIEETTNRLCELFKEFDGTEQATLAAMCTLYSKTPEVFGSNIADTHLLNGIFWGLLLSATQPSLAGAILEYIAAVKPIHNDLLVADSQIIANLYERLGR